MKGKKFDKIFRINFGNRFINWFILSWRVSSSIADCLQRQINLSGYPQMWYEWSGTTARKGHGRGCGRVQCTSISWPQPEFKKRLPHTNHHNHVIWQLIYISHMKSANVTGLKKLAKAPSEFRRSALLSQRRYLKLLCIYIHNIFGNRGNRSETSEIFKGKK